MFLEIRALGLKLRSWLVISPLCAAILRESISDGDVQVFLLLRKASKTVCMVCANGWLT